MMVERYTLRVVNIVSMRIYAQMRRGLTLAHVLRYFWTQQTVAQIYHVFTVAVEAMQYFEDLVGLFAPEGFC